MNKKDMKALDVVLIFIAIFIVLFVIANMIIFCIKDSTPDTLIMSVFGCGIAELAFSAWIEVRKKKNKKKEEVEENETEEQDI